MSKKSSITSVITGDIIQSRRMKNSVWLPKLRKTLSGAGKSPGTWQIYRGDSFQVEIKDPLNCLLTALRLKVTIKSIKGLDVRMAVGIGTKKFSGEQVTESDGEAFAFSGETFETLRNARRTLAIKTPWPEFDREMNLCLRLGAIAMDNWSVGSAELITLMINHPTYTQKTLAKRLGITQPAVSDRMNRAHFEEILELEKLFREKLAKLIAGK